MKCSIVTYDQEELGCCTLQAVYFIPREAKNSSLWPSALGINFFFPWDEIQLLGCKTQFYRSIGYEIPQFTRDGMKMISRKILSNRIFEKAVKKISRKIQIPTHLFPTYVER